jgi:hypothetical protein
MDDLPSNFMRKGKYDTYDLFHYFNVLHSFGYFAYVIE